jgi:hypothetical protein
MGYRIKLLPYKSRQWKVQYQDRTKGIRREYDIKESDYLRLGFHSGMTIDEVRERIRSLNSQESLKRIEKNRQKITERIRVESLVEHALLPTSVEEEFHINLLNTDKHLIMWRTARKLIIQVNLEPKHWAFRKQVWYKAMSGYSFSYIQKILHLLNQWGRFIAYKTETYFEPIPGPRGHQKQMLIDSSELRTAVALNRNDLLTLSGVLSVEQYNWMHISLWLGLRPHEIDSLKFTKNYRYDATKNIIWVYQSKLTAIPTKDRWKPIPLKYPEMLQCIPIIEAKRFKRPLNKTLKKALNGQYTCYSGRKGFTDLMLSMGNGLEAISQWMGHLSIDRTWKDYKAKNKVLF